LSTKKHPNPIIQKLIDRARECGTSDPIIETLVQDWERETPEAIERVVRENMGLAPEGSKPSPMADFIREALNPPAPPAPANESVEDHVRREMKLQRIKPDSESGKS